MAIRVNNTRNHGGGDDNAYILCNDILNVVVMNCDSVSDVLALLQTNKTIHTNAMDGFFKESAPYHNVYKSLLSKLMIQYYEKVTRIVSDTTIHFNGFSLILGSSPSLKAMMKAFSFLDDVMTMNAFCESMEMPVCGGYLNNIIITIPEDENNNQRYTIYRLTDYLRENGITVYTSKEAQRNFHLTNQLVYKLTRNPEQRGRVERLVFHKHRYLKKVRRSTTFSNCVVYDDERGEIVPLISYVCEILPKNITFRYFQPIDGRYNVTVSSLRRLDKNGTLEARVPRLLKTSTLSNVMTILAKNPSYVELVHLH